MNLLYLNNEPRPIRLAKSENLKTHKTSTSQSNQIIDLKSRSELSWLSLCGNKNYSRLIWMTRIHRQTFILSLCCIIHFINKYIGKYTVPYLINTLSYWTPEYNCYWIIIYNKYIPTILKNDNFLIICFHFSSLFSMKGFLLSFFLFFFIYSTLSIKLFVHDTWYMVLLHIFIFIKEKSFNWQQ